MILFCLFLQTYLRSISLWERCLYQCFSCAIAQKKKKVLSYKIQKSFLFFSYKFWTQILSIISRRSLVKRCCLLPHILCPIQIIVNFVLVLCSILCPVVSIVYVFFVKYSIAVILSVINCCIKLSSVTNVNYFI